MSDRVILIDPSEDDTKEETLAEFVFRASAGGTTGLSKINIEQIDPDDRIKAIRLLEIFQKNPGVFKDREIKVEEKSIILNDETIERSFKRLPKEKREDILRMSVKAKDIRIKQEIEARESNVHSDLKPVINLSKKSWKKLPKVGKEAVLRKVCSLEKELIVKQE